MITSSLGIDTPLSNTLSPANNVILPSLTCSKFSDCNFLLETSELNTQVVIPSSLASSV